MQFNKGVELNGKLYTISGHRGMWRYDGSWKRMAKIPIPSWATWVPAYDTNDYANLTYTNFNENECEQYFPIHRKAPAFEEQSTSTEVLDRVIRVTVDGKQDTLVAGVNIKTINGHNILGSGDEIIFLKNMEEYLFKNF